MSLIQCPKCSRSRFYCICKKQELMNPLEKCSLCFGQNLVVQWLVDDLMTGINELDLSDPLLTDHITDIMIKQYCLPACTSLARKLADKLAIHRTSNDWANKLNGIILDPDGWDRHGDFNYSWYEELITRGEFERRMATSTVQLFNIDNIWKDM